MKTVLITISFLITSVVSFGQEQMQKTPERKTGEKQTKHSKLKKGKKPEVSRKVKPASKNSDEVQEKKTFISASENKAVENKRNGKSEYDILLEDIERREKEIDNKIKEIENDNRLSGGEEVIEKLNEEKKTLREKKQKLIDQHELK